MVNFCGEFAVVTTCDSQGRHQGLTARTESGGPGLRGARRWTKDLGSKAGGGKGKVGKKEEKWIKSNLATEKAQRVVFNTVL